MTSDAWVKFGELLFRLGLAVYEAIEAGETEKTVGEILRGRRKDMDKLRELRAAAQAHYAASLEAPKPNVTPEAMRVLKRESLRSMLSHDERLAIDELLIQLDPSDG